MLTSKVSSRTRLAAALPLAMLVLFSGAPSARQAVSNLDGKRLADLRPAMERAVDAGEAVGMEALVVHRGRVVFHEAVGMADLAARRPLQKGTLYRIASMTKPITSVAAMMLVEDGQLALGDPVSRYLPEFSKMRLADGTPARRGITIHDLLTHQSGLTYSFNDRGPVGDAYRAARVSDGFPPPRDPATMAENVRRLAAQPLMFHPGTQFEYGISTDVLGRVVEVVSRQSLDVFMRERIFVPLKMNDTTFTLPESARPRLATLYRKEGDGPLTPAPVQGDFTNVTFLSGGAGLLSTAADYGRFVSMLLNRGELDGVRILSRKTVELMASPQSAPSSPGQRFGLGFSVTTELRNYGSLGTYAWSGIFGTSFWVDPVEQLGGVFMIQTYPRPNDNAGQRFKTGVYRAVE